MADIDLDAEAGALACIAPPGWSEAMAQAALDSGCTVDVAEGPSAAEACKRVAKRLAQWADAPGLAAAVETLLLEGKATFDPPLTRAALAPGAEVAISAALIE